MSTTINPAFTRTDVDGLACIGRSPFDLRGIRFEDGDGGNAPDAAAAQAAADAAAAEAKPPWGDDPTKFDPDKAWALIQNVKGDVAAEKAKRETAIKDAVEASEKALLARFGTALGFGEAAVETDPAKLAATIAEKDTALTAAQAAAKSGALSTQVALLAPGLGGNAKLLLSNEQFKTSIASAEPTDEAAITAAITKALQDNAALKATPSRSGSGEHQGATVQSLETQLAAATQKRDFTETIRLKQAIAAAKQRAAQA